MNSAANRTITTVQHIETRNMQERIALGENDSLISEQIRVCFEGSAHYFWLAANSQVYHGRC